MHYQLKLKDGKTADLLFSMYFFDRVSKLTGKGLTELFPYLLGDMSESDNGIAKGGILDDLGIRAAVLAAAVEAHSFANGNYDKKTLVDGFALMEQVQDSLTSTQWSDIYVILVKSLVADKLPKDEDAKPAKKKQVKNTGLTTSSIPA